MEEARDHPCRFLFKTRSRPRRTLSPNSVRSQVPAPFYFVHDRPTPTLFHAKSRHKASKLWMESPEDAIARMAFVDLHEPLRNLSESTTIICSVGSNSLILVFASFDRRRVSRLLDISSGSQTTAVQAGLCRTPANSFSFQVCVSIS